MEQQDWKNTPRRQSVDSLRHSLLFISTSFRKVNYNIRKQNLQPCK